MMRLFASHAPGSALSAAQRPRATSAVRTGAVAAAGGRREGRCVALRHPVLVRAAQDAAEAELMPEDRAATQTASDSDESQAQPSNIHPLDRIKAAMATDAVDTVALGGALVDLEGELERLRANAAAAEARAAALEVTANKAKDQLLRLNADFENMRRRTGEEALQLSDQVRCDVVTSLLPVVDNFELARTQVKVGNEGEEKIHNSYQALYKQFVEFLRSVGIESVETVGLPFDPNFHEAIMKEANSELADNTVLQEFRKGFKLGDKLLRPAMVKVSVNDFPPMASSEE